MVVDCGDSSTQIVPVFEGYPFARFPGTYDYMDPGMKAYTYWLGVAKLTIHIEIWIGSKMDLEKYVGPGPPVWEG